MTLEQLRIFLAVADGQHMTRAAAKLGLTQSAVSAAIAALEGRHNVRLFDRIGRRITLTEAGRSFVREARGVLNRAETAELVLDDLSLQPRGHIRLFASQTVASYWLPRRLIALHEAYPDIHVDMMVGNSTQAAAAVQDGQADIGLVEGPVRQPDLTCRVIARDRLVLIMAADRADRDLEDLRNATWVLREEGSGTRSEFEAYLRKSGLDIHDLTVALQLPSNEAVLAAVRGSRCVSVLSERAVASTHAAGWISTKPLIGAERTFSALSHPDRYRTRAVSTMLEGLT